MQMKRAASLLMLLILLPIAALAEPMPSFPPEALVPYITLVPGMQHPTVAKLKQRLYDLGYFQSNVVNNSYTEVTAGYIRKFQRQMGLKEDGIATPWLQVLFYSEYAKGAPKNTPRPTAAPRARTTPPPTAAPTPEPTPYIEPDFPLVVGDRAGVWLQGGKLWLSPEVVNLSRSKEVASYVLHCYGRDADGDVLLPGGGEGIYLRFEHPQPLMPEETVQASEMRMQGLEGVKEVYCAVTALQLQDGSLIEQQREQWRFHAWVLP